MKMLCTDKVRLKIYMYGFIAFSCFILAEISYPYIPKEFCVEGKISWVKRDSKTIVGWRGHTKSINYLLKLNGYDYKYDEDEIEKISLNVLNNKLVGRMASLTYIEDNRSHSIYYAICNEEQKKVRSLKLTDGSYSYHDPHPLEYYRRGPMPFAIFATIGAICAILLLRYMYLLIFATDEKREQVFGDKNFNPFK